MYFLSIPDCILNGRRKYARVENEFLSYIQIMNIELAMS